jgi:hypothetical protein
MLDFPFLIIYANVKQLIRISEEAYEARLDGLNQKEPQSSMLASANITNIPQH